MNTHHAIEKAIKNGFIYDISTVDKTPSGQLRSYVMDFKGDGCNVPHVLMQPEFWQALFGKEPNHFIQYDGKARQLVNGVTSSEEWLYMWHKFIDWIAEGKDKEAFFAKIFEREMPEYGLATPTSDTLPPRSSRAKLEAKQEIEGEFHDGKGNCGECYPDGNCRYGV